MQLSSYYLNDQAGLGSTNHRTQAQRKFVEFSFWVQVMTGGHIHTHTGLKTDVHSSNYTG
jgi:hypothetical protein